MDKAKLLEKYIEREFCGEPLTEEQKAAVAETMAFAMFCLRVAVDEVWEPVNDAIETALNFPCSLCDRKIVVHCKDCKHLYGGKFCAFSVVHCKPDGFCSHGEKS